MKEHKMENDFSTLCFTLPLRDNFSTAIHEVSTLTRKLKKSIYPFGFNTMTQVIGLLPGIFGQLVMMWVVSKATIVMSNMPGPKTPYQYGDIKAKGIIGLIPGLGDLAVGISSISHEKNLYMAVQSDTS
jgi:diacylglycerol O-acyltransferase